MTSSPKVTSALIVGKLPPYRNGSVFERQDTTRQIRQQGCIAIFNGVKPIENNARNPFFGSVGKTR